MNEHDSGINKAVKVFYIISLVVLGLDLLMVLFSYFNSYGFVFMLGSFVFLFLFCLSFFGTFILGVINFVHNKVVRKKLLIMFVVLLLFSVFVKFLDNYLKGIDSYNKEVLREEMVNSAKTLINVVKNESENRYIYFLEDLKKIDSSLNGDYDAGSYVKNFNDDVYVCLSDKNYVVEGYGDNLKVSTIGTISKSCSYHIGNVYNVDTKTSFNEAEFYLKYFLELKYNISVNKVEAVLNYDLFGSETDHYDVTTNAGVFEAMVKVVDNKIIVTDNYDEFVHSLTGNNLLITEIEPFTKSYFDTNNLNELEVPEAQNINDSYVMIQVSFSKEEAQEYAKALADYLTQLKETGNIMIRKLIQTKSECDSLSECIDGVQSEYVVLFSINNGIVTWK